MRTRILVALAVVAALVGTAGLVCAMQRQYSSGINGLSATATSAYTAFTDNHTGGNGAAFGAMEIKVYNRGTGTCFFNPGELTATTQDHIIPSGATYIWPYDTTANRNGYAGVAYICTSGQTATLDVSAWR